MPIKPENKARYPENWSTEIVPRIRKRSGPMTIEYWKKVKAKL